MSARPISFAAAAVPRRIGKYIVSHIVGEGAMGIVYKAIDPHIHRSVAIKTIRQPLLDAEIHDAAAAQRFRHEAQAAGRLNHPNIVSIFEYGESDGGLYIVMEFVEGRSLLEMLTRGPRLSLGDTMAVMLQLLDALEAAHAQNVWHRDIKPANLLFTTDGRLKVSDFGIARIDAHGLTQAATVLGSPGYMAPERYTGEAPDQRVDLFSCGVLLYQLLTGQSPFRGDASTVMYQVLHQEPVAPSSLQVDTAPPTGFDAVVARALAKRPDDRYSSAREMRDALLAAAPPGTVGRTLTRLDPLEAAPTLWEPREETQAAPPLAPYAPYGPPSRPGPGTWDPQALARIEELLRPHLGPVSRIAVREVARRSSSVSALIAKLASGTLQADERKAFLEQAASLISADKASAPATVPPHDPPVLGETPLRPEVVERAARVLAAQIGPIATLLARRAAERSSTVEQFFCRLADQAGADIDRKALLDKLWRIA